jgi:transposase
MDRKGRVRVSQEQRRILLAEFERSGVSAVQYAQRIGLKYSTLAGWLQRYRRTKPKVRAGAVRLLEAVVTEAQEGDPNSSLRLQLPDGTRIEIRNTKQAALAADLLRALAQPC